MGRTASRLRDLLDRYPRAITVGVVGSALVLVGLAVVLAIGTLNPPPTADASPTADPSGPSASPSADSPEPSADSPEPSTSPPENALMFQVSVDGLRMRETASANADIVRGLDRGEVLRVKSGPVDADGYAWYEVVGLDSVSGWAAMGDEADPWLEVVPADPAAGELLLRFQRDCAVSPRGNATFPYFPPDLTLTADGRVVQGWGITVVRQLSPPGQAQIEREVLDLPVLQESADYGLERLPNTPDPPGHDACRNSFVLGEGTARVVVGAVNWQGGEEEAMYWVPSPERRALDELAIDLLDIESWLEPDAWEEPEQKYVSNSYLFWLETWSPVVPTPTPPSLTDAAWPFDGPVNEFGDPVMQARCGYLDLGQAFETLRLMRERGVTMWMFGDPQRAMSLDRVGSGTFATGADWFSFMLTPRSPDGYPSCTG